MKRPNPKFNVDTPIRLIKRPARRRNCPVNVSR
jgi:hypothetical protein